MPDTPLSPLPSWRNAALQRKRVFDWPTVPSAAFGDGSHATTRLCARGVDLWSRTRGPGAVLDVGTGTGVLARIARAHGAPSVVATDIDPKALAAARANIMLDEKTLAHQEGQLNEILVTDAAPDSWGARFDLVVANILEGVLLHLTLPLCAALAPKGTLIISGFTRPQAPVLRAAFVQHGLAFELQAEDDGWVAQQFRRG